MDDFNGSSHWINFSHKKISVTFLCYEKSKRNSNEKLQELEKPVLDELK